MVGEGGRRADHTTQLLLALPKICTNWKLTTTSLVSRVTEWMSIQRWQICIGKKTKDGCVVTKKDLELVVSSQRLPKVGGLAAHKEVVLVQNFLSAQLTILESRRKHRNKCRKTNPHQVPPCWRISPHLQKLCHQKLLSWPPCGTNTKHWFTTSSLQPLP